MSEAVERREEEEEGTGKQHTHRPESPSVSESGGEPPHFSINEPGPPDTKGNNHRQRSGTSSPSCVSVVSDSSVADPPYFSTEPKPSETKGNNNRQRSGTSSPSCVSVVSDSSVADPPYFSTEPKPSETKGHHLSLRPASPSCVSVVSDSSLADPPYFSADPRPSETKGHHLSQRPASPSCVSVVSDSSVADPPYFSADPRPLETKEKTPRLKTPSQIRNGQNLKDYKILLCSLDCVKDGITGETVVTLINIYTELYITEGESEGVNKQHEVWQLETASKMETLHDAPIRCCDVFKILLSGRKTPIRSVLTKGIAGIGKTFSVRKFTVDWAKGLENQDVDLVVLFSFRELNLVRDEQHSLLTLIHVFHPTLKKLTAEQLAVWKVVFIIDGVDESSLPLDFHNNDIVSDVTVTSSVDVLLTNLIKGLLLPSALLWLTTRPAAANQIPPACVDVVTEVRGFTDPQKEEYFRKRFDEKLANRILSHLKTARSLYIMCYLPLFCCIMATILQNMLRTDETLQLPKTLTAMFCHFLLVQTEQKKHKYDDTHDVKQLVETDWDVLLKLGRLAFQHLEKGSILFYEEDLEACGLDVKDASLYSGMCTAIFRRDCLLFKRMIYCFVHLSIQEFLAAVYLLHCFAEKNIQVLKAFLDVSHFENDDYSHMSLDDFLERTIKKSLDSKNGHLDLVVRFLHGLSLESNQVLLGRLPARIKNSPESIQRAISNLKDMRTDDEHSPDRCINIFHCLMEMNDQSVYQEIQQYLKSGDRLKIQLPETLCSALAYMLQMSEEVLDELNLDTYNTSDLGRWRLIPAVRNSRKARFIGCNLRETHFEVLASVLSSNPSHLRELDISHNRMQNSGLARLCAGLKSSYCRLDILRLVGCKLSETQCELLASALNADPSHLKELDISYNKMRKSFLEILSAGLKNPHCSLETLRLAGCNIKETECEVLASALSSNPSRLKELDLSNNNLQDSGLELLAVGLMSPHCSLESLRLSHCWLSERCCGVLASVLSSNPCLRELVLSFNNLQDSGLIRLSAGLKSPHCELKTLGLSGCGVTEEGCSSLASALRFKASHLKQLELSCNHPGDSGPTLMSAGVEMLNMNHGGQHWIKPQLLRRYFHRLTLDTNTANGNLSLSENNRKAAWVERVQSYPDHPDRFDIYHQVLCTVALTGCCYWEVAWSALVCIALTYRGINRKGKGVDCRLGFNAKSWILVCDGLRNRYIVRHNRNKTILPVSPSGSNRVGVYLDSPAGTLSFYRVSVSSDTLTHMYTFQSTFTEPLYPGFGLFWSKSASVSLCEER